VGPFFGDVSIDDFHVPRVHAFCTHRNRAWQRRGQPPQRLYFEAIGSHLPRREQRESFATYFFGILSDGERKSVEPIAARACGDPHGTKRSQDRLLHFLGQSPWSDQAVRREAARQAIAAMTEHAPVTTWIIDDSTCR